jgi:hypothetical protein
MFQQMKNAGKRALLALVVSTGLAASPAMAAVISFNPTTVNTAVGSTTAIEVRIAGLAAGQDLGAFDINVLFDASQLSLASYTLGNGLGDLAAFDAFEFSAGAIAAGVFNLAEVSFLADLGVQADAFTLATLNFTSLHHGASALSFGGVTLGDAFGNAVTADTVNATVTAIPEPASVYLMLSALALMGLTRRARK